MSRARKRCIVTHHERTANGLLAALSPVSGLIAATQDPKSFIYRGVGSDAYRLVPAALRGKRLPFPDNRPVYRRNYENQIWAEVEYFAEFLRIADARGLRIPEDSHQFRALLNACRKPDYVERLASGKVAWPPEGLVWALGLAQHYGVPTRLLDWSSSAWVSAYFAAASALHDQVNGPAVVWAFDATTFFLQGYDEFSYLSLRDRVGLVVAPGSDIPNLQAQQGLFMVVRESQFKPTATFQVRPYDSVLIRQMSMDYDRTLLYRFTFPAKEAPDLLRQLSVLGVDASTLFPGHAGAAQAVRERLLWPPPGSKYEQRMARTARRRFGTKWKRFA